MSIKGFKFDGVVHKYDYNSLDNIPDLNTETDKTLAIDGVPADAKATGDRISNLQSLVGSPLTASTAASMTDTNKVYVYTGSETGYTNGNWYYHDGTSWVSGGVYNSVAVDLDSTLTLANKAPDSKVVGDAIDSLNEDITNLIMEPEETEADLYVCDRQGNVIAEFVDGHIVTKNFNSSTLPTALSALSTAISGKIATQQNASDAGKALVIGSDGTVSPAELAPEIEVDATLSQAGEAADAKAVGDAIAAIPISDMIHEASESSADLYVCDSFGNVVAEFKDGHIVLKNFDSSDYADVLTDIETLKTEIRTDILGRTKSQLDGIYAACRWHQPNYQSKQFCLLMGGDVHYESSKMNNMIDLLNGVDAFDAGIMLGDMSGNTFSDTIQFYKDALENAQKPFLTVIGNHDVAGATSDSDLWTKYGSCLDAADLDSGEAVSGKLYYYKDFASQKIRVIVLMQYDYTYTGDLCFGQTQIDWLIGVLNSTPSDYGVIIAEHTNSSRYMTYQMDTAYTSDTWRQSNYAPTVMSGDPVPDIVNAWIGGSTLSQTYSYTFSNHPADLSVSADFTARGTGEFITYIGGHWHMDVLGHPTSYADQMDYHVPATGLNAATQGDIPRKAGTASEDSLCVLGVDREKKTVKIFHVGAHYTKDAVDRQYFQYSYGGAS